MPKLLFLLLVSFLLVACNNDESSGLPETPEVVLPANLAWQVPLNPDSSYHSSAIAPLIAGDRILYAARSSSNTIAGEALHCVDTEGHPLWTWNDYVESLRSNVIDAAAVTATTVVIRAGAHYYGINLNDGSTRWHQIVYARSEGPMVAFEGRCYQRFATNGENGFDGASIRYFDALTGTLTRVVGQWDLQGCDVHYSTPTLARGADGAARMYYTSYACATDSTQGFIRHHAYNEVTGSTDYSLSTDLVDQRGLAAPLLTEDRVVKLHNDWVECRSRATGELLWTKAWRLGFSSTIEQLVQFDNLIIWQKGSHVIALALATGETMWERDDAPGKLVVDAPYAVYTNYVLWSVNAATGEATERTAAFNDYLDFSFYRADYRDGAVIDAERDRLYTSDGFFLIALNLPL